MMVATPRPSPIEKHRRCSRPEGSGAVYTYRGHTQPIHITSGQSMTAAASQPASPKIKNSARDKNTNESCLATYIAKPNTYQTRANRNADRQAKRKQEVRPQAYEPDSQMVDCRLETTCRALRLPAALSIDRIYTDMQTDR
eukprot:GHVU01196090.1.p1 GENE.GHVU01196090.1~~GHVU01196090.1.p1  ORF type:complete len:141 (-),score=7.52 GHVU01196090.1:229-651(-)